jgi:hypothetical protein
LIVRTTVETLAGLPNAPAGEIDGGGMVPSETVQRLACDSALIRITGKAELEGEITRASRTTPASTRRAVEERDRGRVAEHCTRPARWADAHHLKHWAHGGPTGFKLDPALRDPSPNGPRRSLAAPAIDDRPMGAVTAGAVLALGVRPSLQRRGNSNRLVA